MLSKKSLTVLGSNITYLDEGVRENPAVLLIHGFPESSLLWKDIIPAIISSGYRAIAPDLPGFGGSDRFINTPHTWDNYVNFITSFLESLQIESIHLVVHDWGGLIGLRWARMNPERILSLVVTDTVYCSAYEWHNMAQRLQDPDHGEMAIEKMAEKTTWFSRMKQMMPTIAPEVLNDFYRIYETIESRKVALELYRSGDLRSLINHRGDLKRIKKPATIIWGDKDPFVSKEFAYKLQQEELPHASVHIVDDAGHFIHIEAADVVSQIVKDHLAAIKN